MYRLLVTASDSYMVISCDSTRFGVFVRFFAVVRSNLSEALPALAQHVKSTIELGGVACARHV